MTPAEKRNFVIDVMCILVMLTVGALVGLAVSLIYNAYPPTGALLGTVGAGLWFLSAWAVDLLRKLIDLVLRAMASGDL